MEEVSIARIVDLLMIQIIKKKMEIKEYHYGEGYFPKLFIKDGKIVDARCKCKWSQIHPNAFKEGDTICKHIISAMKEYELDSSHFLGQGHGVIVKRGVSSSSPPK